jgi:hypothetical protein
VAVLDLGTCTRTGKADPDQYLPAYALELAMADGHTVYLVAPDKIEYTAWLAVLQRAVAPCAVAPPHPKARRV